MENKKILITGANSYIGTSFERWVSKYDRYQIDTINLRNDNWKSHDFSKYDSILHVAAIVHKKEKRGDEALYNEVNTELAYEVAKKAKKEGVKQFIFMSSMAVYGCKENSSSEVIIKEDTICRPDTYYGKSKLNAERKLVKLNKNNFKIAILRPPMVYGPNCPGNYARLEKLILKTPVFPMIKNKRSMLFVNNLSEFIRLVVDMQAYGVFFPQNKEYVNTIRLAKLIAKNNCKKLKTIRIFNFLANLSLILSKNFSKVFGSFIYDKRLNGSPGTNINGQKIDYETVSFEESIDITERVVNNS
jgi:UDP-glucose 4-epimerase